MIYSSVELNIYWAFLKLMNMFFFFPERKFTIDVQSNETFEKGFELDSCVQSSLATECVSSEMND